MEKTIEYMRTAVLAECELLDFSTEGGFSYPRARTPIEGIGIILMRGKYELSIYGSICQPIVESDSITKLAYSVLGLDKRDALEAEKEKSKRWESRAWKILKIVRRRETEQRPKTAAVLRTLREVSEKNEQLLAQLEEIKYEDEVNGKGWENNHNSTYSRLCRVLEAYKEGKKDEN